MAQHDIGRAEHGRNDYISLWHLPTFLITPILNHGNGRPESLSSPLFCSQVEAACFFMDLVEVPLPEMKTLRLNWDASGAKGSLGLTYR